MELKQCVKGAINGFDTLKALVENGTTPIIGLFTFGGRGNFGTVQTKAVVCGNHLIQHGRYLLGNKTAELIKENLGYNFLPVELINAVSRQGLKSKRLEKKGGR
ncbi:hypothetical protein TNCV_3914181 [Trichonephila clavipes]|nr:hypothetical protein TNCV_3914181 [Trichonephila clavipes]